MLDRERLELALVQMSRADVVVVRGASVFLAMRLGQPGQPTNRENPLPVFRPQDQVPVVGHEAVRQDAHGHCFFRLGQHAQPRLEITGLVQESAVTVAAVEHMVDQSVFPVLVECVP